MHYGKYAVRVEGAPAMIQVTTFQKAMGVALILTELIPWRYTKFETNVLGPTATPEQKAEVTATEKAGVYAHDAGFARTDALTRIGNQVFASDMANDANYVVSKAPRQIPPVMGRLLVHLGPIQLLHLRSSGPQHRRSPRRPRRR